MGPVKPLNRSESRDGLASHMDGVPLLVELVRRLVETFHPERIYLFGSRARGEGSPHSDYDLMVVVAQSELPGYRPLEVRP